MNEIFTRVSTRKFEDGSMLHDWEGWCRENGGIQTVNTVSGQACSIDRKGC